VSGAVTFVAALIAIWLVAGRALRPIHLVASTAEDIRLTGDLGQRLPDSRGWDELNRLARAFNGMLERLADAQSRLAGALGWPLERLIQRFPLGQGTAPSARRRWVVAALTANGVNTKRVQLLGTGLWDDPRIFSAPALDGGWYAAPESTGFRNFSSRYRTRYGQDPVRTATLAYDAVALVAALVKTQGPQRFSEQILTNSSGFAGIDGIFRFRPDGTNERGLSVLRVTPTGGQVIGPAPKSFAPGT